LARAALTRSWNARRLPGGACPRAAMGRVVALLDLDAFYVQVALLERPHLRGRPVGVTQKHIVVTCSYEARARGVGKLMPVSEARQLCPELELVCGEDLSPFRRASARVWATLLGFGCAVQRVGLDEFFCELTRAAADAAAAAAAAAAAPLTCEGHAEGLEDAAALASDEQARALAAGSRVLGRMRRAVLERTGLTSSGGVARNKMLAKLAASLHKPDQQTALFAPAAARLVPGLSLRQLPGVGHATRRLLAPLGVATAADLQRLSIDALRAALHSERLAQRVFEVCRGEDADAVAHAEAPKSVAVEESARRCASWGEARALLALLARDLAARLAEDAALYARHPRVLAVRARGSGLGAGGRATRQAAFPRPDAPGEAIAAAAERLLRRLLGAPAAAAPPADAAALPQALAILGLAAAEFAPAAPTLDRFVATRPRSPPPSPPPASALAPRLVAYKGRLTLAPPPAAAAKRAAVIDLTGDDEEGAAARAKRPRELDASLAPRGGE
jgi:DNA polymerase iota